MSETNNIDGVDVPQKSVAKEAAKSAAIGTGQGAAKGGVHGAAIGAVAGLVAGGVKAAAENKSARNQAEGKTDGIGVHLAKAGATVAETAVSKKLDGAAAAQAGVSQSAGGISSANAAGQANTTKPMNASSSAGDKLTDTGEDGKKLGQGGTSLIDDNAGNSLDESGQLKDQKGDKALKQGAITVAGGLAGAATFVYMKLMMLLKLLLQLLAMLAALVKNAVSLALAAIWAGLQAVLTPVFMISSAVAAVFSAPAIVASTIAILLAVAPVVAIVVFTNQKEVIVALPDSCQVSKKNKRLLDVVAQTDANQIQIENAKTIYSVLASLGMGENNIAGILGNWEAESGIDPTSVEGYHSPKYQLDDNKSKAARNENKGIGLGQWTGGRNKNLREFAFSSNTEWHKITTQLAFMLSSVEGDNAQIVKDMIETDAQSPAEAAKHFHDVWERSADTPEMAARRGANAKKWFALFSGFSKDDALANSVINLSGTTISKSAKKAFKKARKDCRKIDAKNISLKDGGLTTTEAQKIVDLYNLEGHKFLFGRYQGGGPAQFNNSYIMNCVSFSTYFLNKYTQFQKGTRGDGIDIAKNMAQDSGLTVTKTPVAYSLASGPTGQAYGHTFIVLGVEGDNVILGEANYGISAGQIRIRSAQELMANGWDFVELNSIMLPKGQEKTS